MTTDKDLIARLRNYEGDYHCPPRLLADAADRLESLTAPVVVADPPMRRSYIEGSDPPQFRPDPNGPYVLWDDAAAALAAEKAKREAAEARALRVGISAEVAECEIATQRARAERYKQALTEARSVFVVEYDKNGGVASVGYASDALRPLITMLDAALEDKEQG